MPIWVGIDWSETYQDWAAVDEVGAKVLSGRFRETVLEFNAFETKIRAYADPSTGALPTIAIETEKGLTVASLRQRGYSVYAINPLKVARYRDRSAVSHGKSDKGDSKMLADILRTDPDVHRPLPEVSPGASALAVLARAHQDEVWRVRTIAQEARSLLRLYYPTALEVYPAKALPTREARLVLAACPTPSAAAAKRLAGWKSLLRDAGRVKYIDRDAERRIATFRAPALRCDPEQEAAFGNRLSALMTVMDGAVRAQQTIEAQMVEALQAHPMYSLFETIKGIGDVTAARLLGEIGDDPNRFADQAAIRAYAGTAPITRASGRSLVVNRRRVKNNRLNNAAFMWALNAAKHTPGGKLHYTHRKEVGDAHAAALRNLGNRLIGCLWHCMVTGQVWDEQTVWGHRYDLDSIVLHYGPKADEANVDDDDERIETAMEASALAAGDDLVLADVSA